MNILSGFTRGLSNEEIIFVLFCKEYRKQHKKYPSIDEMANATRMSKSVLNLVASSLKIKGCSCSKNGNWNFKVFDDKEEKEEKKKKEPKKKKTPIKAKKKKKVKEPEPDPVESEEVEEQSSEMPVYKDAFFDKIKVQGRIKEWSEWNCNDLIKYLNLKIKEYFQIDIKMVEVKERRLAKQLIKILGISVSINLVQYTVKYWDTLARKYRLTGVPCMSVIKPYSVSFVGEMNGRIRETAKLRKDRDSFKKQESKEEGKLLEEW